ncbi:hypothetical protein GGS26DRAFT_550518 [Hypomontagnella submonticulosa]|nr:hypothetical protein GGS26DRAFT_550518 [Hypomontagnella submonticulosa]
MSEYHDGLDQAMELAESLSQRFDKTKIKDYRKDIYRWNRCWTRRLPQRFETAQTYRAVVPILHCLGWKGIILFVSSRKTSEKRLLLIEYA